MFRVFIKPFWRHNYLEDRLHHRHLHFPVSSCSGGQRWRGVDLYQPWLEVVFNQNIISVHLEAMLIVDDHRLQPEQQGAEAEINTTKSFSRWVNEEAEIKILTQRGNLTDD